MLYFVGFTEADFKKPVSGIASTWSQVTPCNMHIEKLALAAEKGTAMPGLSLALQRITCVLLRQKLCGKLTLR